MTTVNVAWLPRSWYWRVVLYYLLIGSVLFLVANAWRTTGFYDPACASCALSAAGHVWHVLYPILVWPIAFASEFTNIFDGDWSFWLHVLTVVVFVLACGVLERAVTTARQAQPKKSST